MLYQDILLDHYKHPRNGHFLAEQNLEGSASNSACGDKVTIQALIENERVLICTFQGTGCVISQATASLLTVEATKKSVQELAAYTTADIFALIGIHLGPVRARCALLSLEALHQGVALYKKRNA